MEAHIVGITVLLFVLVAVNGDAVPFDRNYIIVWSESHVKVKENGSEVELNLDQSSGSGFGSKLSYGSGFFRMSLKLPGNNDTHGVLPTYYLTSHTNNHDELDFEFLGNDTLPFLVQTNVFASGVGNREQRIALWFDPRTDYHSYGILWNEKQIVFFVDETPIRVFRNASNIGVGYPYQPMQIVATIWHADWASEGKPTNWTQSPFVASYRGFGIDGCSTVMADKSCVSPNFWWNSPNHWQLDSQQANSYRDVRKTYLIYDYCSDKSRYPVPPPECSVNQ